MTIVESAPVAPFGRMTDHDLDVDRGLVARAQSGDPAAFDALYRRHRSRLHRFCLRQVGDPDVADEVVQDAFVRAHRALGRFDGDRFYPWLTVIARHLCIDRSRRTTPDEVGIEDVAADDRLPSGADHADRYAEAWHLQAAMREVAPRHREVLSLRHEHDLSYEEIASRLDLPVTTVQTLLFRARRSFRRQWDSINDTLPCLPAGGLAWWWRRKFIPSTNRPEMVDALINPLLALTVALTAVAAGVFPAANPDSSLVTGGPTPSVEWVGLVTAPGSVPDTGEPSSPDPQPRAPAPPSDAADAPTDPAPGLEVGPVSIEPGDQVRDHIDDMPVRVNVGGAEIGAEPQHVAPAPVPVSEAITEDLELDVEVLAP